MPTGDSAAVHVAMRADNLLEKDDVEGAAVWNGSSGRSMNYNRRSPHRT